MARPVLVAAAQMNSGADKSSNVEAATRLAREAAALGASLVAFPENFAWLGPESERQGAAEPLDGPTLSRMAALARELKIILLAGSILEAGAPAARMEASLTPHSDGRFFNSSALFGPDGARLAVYRKIHLFDVDVRDGATYRESAAVAAGSDIVCAESPIGKIGLSVCYDLRFPELYRALSQRGAVLLTVPSAFTLMTGKDHWEVLLRARAIENQSYVLAPAQQGHHSEKRMTWGHSMLVDPWGLVTARASEGVGLAVGRVDLDLMEKIRRDLPALAHRRL